MASRQGRSGEGELQLGIHHWDSPHFSGVRQVQPRVHQPFVQEPDSTDVGASRLVADDADDLGRFDPPEESPQDTEAYALPFHGELELVSEALVGCKTRSEHAPLARGGRMMTVRDGRQTWRSRNLQVVLGDERRVAGKCPRLGKSSSSKAHDRCSQFTDPHILQETFTRCQMLSQIGIERKKYSPKRCVVKNNHSVSCGRENCEKSSRVVKNHHTSDASAKNNHHFGCPFTEKLPTGLRMLPPDRRSLGRYIFLIDVESHCKDGLVRAALTRIRPRATMFKMLRSLPAHTMIPPPTAACRLSAPSPPP